MEHPIATQRVFFTALNARAVPHRPRQPTSTAHIIHCRPDVFSPIEANNETFLYTECDMQAGQGVFRLLNPTMVVSVQTGEQIG